MFLKFRYFLFILPLLFLIGCKSTVTIAEIDALEKVVVSENFEFEATSANPMPIANVSGLQNLLPVGSNLSNINLIGNVNYFKIKKDSLHYALPYFGERQIGGAYNSSDVGLKFNGKVENSTTTYNSKKKSYSLKYKVKVKNENLNFNLTLFTNNKASLTVISSHRSNINYNGIWKAE